MAHDEVDDTAATTASCRLCFKPSVADDQRHPIVMAANAENGDGCGKTRAGGGLRDTIVKHLQIQVSEDDGLSKIVCSECLTQLNEWEQFYEMCSKNNDMHLKQLSDGDDKNDDGDELANNLVIGITVKDDGQSYTNKDKSKSRALKRSFPEAPKVKTFDSEPVKNGQTVVLSDYLNEFYNSKLLIDPIIVDKDIADNLRIRIEVLYDQLEEKIFRDWHRCLVRYQHLLTELDILDGITPSFSTELLPEVTLSEIGPEETSVDIKTENVSDSEGEPEVPPPVSVRELNEQQPEQAGRKPRLPCTVCTKTFARSIFLTRHLKHMHKIEQVSTRRRVRKSGNENGNSVEDTKWEYHKFEKTLSTLARIESHEKYLPSKKRLMTAPYEYVFCCDQNFSDSDQLNEHIAVAHGLVIDWENKILKSIKNSSLK